MEATAVTQNVNQKTSLLNIILKLYQTQPKTNPTILSGT